MEGLSKKASKKLEVVLTLDVCDKITVYPMKIVLSAPKGHLCSRCKMPIVAHHAMGGGVLGVARIDLLHDDVFPNSPNFTFHISCLPGISVEGVEFMYEAERYTDPRLFDKYTKTKAKPKEPSKPKPLSRRLKQINGSL